MIKESDLVEHCVTRDAQIPLVEGDHDFYYGFQCVPLRPKPRLDDGSWSSWERCDCCDKDYKTGRRRFRELQSAAAGRTRGFSPV